MTQGLHDRGELPFNRYLGELVQLRLAVELNLRDFELQQTFRGVYDGDIVADPSEVADVKRMSLAALADAVAHSPNDFTPWLRSRLRALGWAHS